MIKQGRPINYRHELKYIVNSLEGSLLSSRLSILFPKDSHTDTGGDYRVSSLYFDTPTDKALRQKMDSVNKREKFRIRYYGNNPQFFKLEKKIKKNGLCAKYNARLSIEQVKCILKRDYDFLKSTEDPLLIEFYSKLSSELLEPKAIVVYDREAFIYTPGNVRITIDKNLRTSPGSTDFLDISRVHMDVMAGQWVLEIKYDEFLPDLVRMSMWTNGYRQIAFSKYAMCRRLD